MIPINKFTHKIHHSKYLLNYSVVILYVYALVMLKWMVAAIISCIQLSVLLPPSGVGRRRLPSCPLGCPLVQMME